MVRQQGMGASEEMLPESETDYNVIRFNVRISFVRDAGGKVTGLTGYSDGDFEAKKLD